MIITTAQKPSPNLKVQANRWAKHFNLEVVERENDSIERLYHKYNTERILVITRDQPKLHIKGIVTPYFFHPGLSLLRIKQLLNGDNDLLVEVAELKSGDSFLDCTLGLAGDSIVASFAVGNKGRVVGIESEEIIALLTKEGLSKWEEPLVEFNEALRRIEVIHQSHLEFLRQQPDESFDVVYFDPMFRSGITGSPGISSLRGIANHQPIQVESVEEALRVCKRKVIMKERSGSIEFRRLGFSSIKRASASITYGVIEK